VIEQARAAAERTFSLAEDNDAKIEAAFRRTLGRAPSPVELEKCRRFLGSEPSLETWAELQQTLFACVDFRYIE